ncbi:MAG TPA: ribonuclease J [Candidatus Paceibacterota bacterium]
MENRRQGHRRHYFRAPMTRVVRKDGVEESRGAAQKPEHRESFMPGTPHNNAPHTARRRSMPFSPERGLRREKPQFREQRHEEKANVTLSIPGAGENIRIIPLGGVEEIGKNMTAIEYKNDIVIIDIGLAFKDEDTPGIDYILPNTKYLEERKERVRAVIITHGHLDHIGGVPYVMPRIGNPPLYTRNLTALMIKKRQSEFPHLPPIDFKIVENDETITVGEMKIKFFGVTHSIPDCLGICIKTPWGNIINPGDYKLEHTDGIPSDAEEKVYGELAKEPTLLLMTDSTNIENPGFSTPEALVHKNLDEIVRTIKTRLIISMFSSHVLRIAKIVEACEKYNKKVVVEGRSMKNNIDICKEAGILDIKKDTVIPATDIHRYPPDRIVILATGAQGDDFAALTRLANKTHKTIQLGKNDTVVLSSSIIPGNERAVQAMKDNITRRGAKIVHYRTSEVFIHSTGHGNRGEIEWLHKKLKPKFFIPIHGNHYMLRLHADLAQGLGTHEDHIAVPDNGSLIEIENGEKIKMLKEKAPSNPVMVDGFAVGDMQEVVLRDRQMLAQDGMFVIIASINSQTGKLKKSPDIISRGFVYLRENQELLRQARIIIKKTIEDNASGQHPINFDFIKDVVTDNLSRFLFQKTAKRPLVIPVLLGV